jgi:GrpB-like predicted nucleotidyltransferase (UPF0157 family)/L-amino acid N-acyltransferase YncA
VNDREAPVHVVPYDPSWPSLFDRERAALEQVLAPWLAGPIEHVGSTAVSGLAAKPVIDIMAAVESLPASRPAIQALTNAGYVYLPYRAEAMHWFCKPSLALRTYHLHLVPLHSQLWRDRLVFRDYLRRHPALADEYAALKRRLAQIHEFDREAYTSAKGPFVRRVLTLAVGETTFTVRPARDADAPGIFEAHTKAIREICSGSYSEREIEAWAGRHYLGAHLPAIRSQRVVVVEDGEGIAGFGELDHEGGEVRAVYVHPRAVRRGIGSAILAELERIARDAGLRSLHLSASINAVSFYQRRDFRAENRTTLSLAPDVAIACVVMRKDLGSPT